MGGIGELEFLEAEVWVALEICVLVTAVLLLLMGLKKTFRSPIKHKLAKNHSQTLD